MDCQETSDDMGLLEKGKNVEGPPDDDVIAIEERDLLSFSEEEAYYRKL